MGTQATSSDEETRSASPKGGTSPAPNGGGSVRSALIGQPYDIQMSMLAPRSGGQASSAASHSVMAPAVQLRAIAEAPVQRHVRSVQRVDAPLSNADKMARIAAVEADSASKFRTQPAGLEEQTAMKAAKSGNGRVVPIPLTDPRLQGMNVVKMEFTQSVQNALGNPVSITIHWFREQDLAKDFAFKFKNEPFKKMSE